MEEGKRMAKKQYSYKIRSYVNASHAVRWEEGTGKEHIHTWEITCEIKTLNNHMVVFDDIEAVLESVFSVYAGGFLNEIAPFDKINPTLENVTEYLFQVIGEKLNEIQANLIRIEVGESPKRLYCISLDTDE